MRIYRRKKRLILISRFIHKTTAITLLVFCLFILFFQKNDFEAKAQVSSSGFAISVPLKESGISAGSIICSYSEGFSPCKNEYDTSIYGVSVDEVSVSVEDRELENSTLVLATGIVTVRVNSIAGNISEGDFITSSETPGVGKKANKNGYVVGVAMQDYVANSPDDVGNIQVTLNIHPASSLTGTGSNLLQFIRKGLTVPIFEPLESLRYILAVLMVLISFTLGMMYFGRSSRAGIEAIGRNPLAKKVIQLTVFLNITLTIIIVLVGLAIAYLILIL